jgi:hypothetical protein
MDRLVLQRLARRTHKIAQGSHVGTIRADAAGIHWQPEALRKIQIHPGVIQFRKTETRGRLHPVHPRRIHGAWRTVTLPGTPRQFVKLLPIAFVPSVHRSFASPLLDAAKPDRVRCLSKSQSPSVRRVQNCARTVLLIVSRRERAKKILRLMFQTRQPLRCFGHSFCFGAKCRNQEPGSRVRTALQIGSVSSIRRDSTCKGAGMASKISAGCENQSELREIPEPKNRAHLTRTATFWADTRAPEARANLPKHENECTEEEK